MVDDLPFGLAVMLIINSKQEIVPQIDLAAYEELLHP